MKIRSFTYSDGTIHHLYMCPGCGYEHAFSPNVHKFNGDLEKPTITPSLLNDNPQHYKTCHSFITDGKIAFCGDSWHNLKNKTVELPDYLPLISFLKALTKSYIRLPFTNLFQARAINLAFFIYLQ